MWPDEQKQDCSTCDRAECLRESRITARHHGLPTVEVGLDNWHELITAGQSALGRAAPEFVFRIYDICPVPVISALSCELLRVWRACGGTERCRTPRDYYDLPAIYVQASDIIDAEMAKIKAAKEREMRQQK
jgi:hypothetical protein